MPVASARHAGPPALTHLACPRALAWALFVFAWGRALLGLVVGVFACGWLGFVFTRGACSPFGVCVLWCWRACLGWWGNHCPAAPAPLAWLVLTLWCGLEKRVRGGVCGVGGGRQVGRDMVVPPLYVRWWRCPPPDAWRGRREGLGVRALSWCANTRAHGERKRGGRGGASWGGPWWSGRGSVLLVRALGAYNSSW